MLENSSTMITTAKQLTLPLFSHEEIKFTHETIRKNVILHFNHAETALLELVLRFLSDQSYREDQEISIPEIRQLTDWELDKFRHIFNQARLKATLHYKEHIKLILPFRHLKEIESIIATVLQYGITEDYLTSLAAEETDYEQDMENFYAEDPRNTCSLAEFQWHERFRCIRDGYYHLVEQKDSILNKLNQAWHNLSNN